MRKRTLWVIALGLAATLLAGGLYASNMGFKLNHPLKARELVPPYTSLDGTNAVALPFNQQTNLVNAGDFIIDIDTGEVAPTVSQVCEWRKIDNGKTCYSGFSGTNFNLTPGEGYLVQVTADANYIVVGSHDPIKAVPLKAREAIPPYTTLDGTNLFAMPYHTTLTDAGSMIIEIDTQAGLQVVSQVCEWRVIDNGKTCYSGFSGTNFNLTPGQGYLIQVTADDSYTPSHY